MPRNRAVNVVAQLTTVDLSILHFGEISCIKSLQALRC